MEQRVLDRQPDSVMLRAEWMYDYISPRGNYLLNVLNAEIHVRVKVMSAAAGGRTIRTNWTGL